MATSPSDPARLCAKTDHVSTTRSPTRRDRVASPRGASWGLVGRGLRYADSAALPSHADARSGSARPGRRLYLSIDAFRPPRPFRRGGRFIPSTASCRRAACPRAVDAAGRLLRHTGRDPRIAGRKLAARGPSRLPLSPSYRAAGAMVSDGGDRSDADLSGLASLPSSSAAGVGGGCAGHRPRRLGGTPVAGPRAMAAFGDGTLYWSG